MLTEYSEKAYFKHFFSHVQILADAHRGKQKLRELRVLTAMINR